MPYAYIFDASLYYTQNASNLDMILAQSQKSEKKGEAKYIHFCVSIFFLSISVKVTPVARS